MQTLRARYRDSSWFVPMFAVGLGVVMLIAEWIGGDPKGGVVSLGIMVVFAALIVVAAGHSGTAAIMRRPAVDERARSIDLAATAFAGVVLIVAVLVAFVYELAKGQDASPYTQLGALAGVAYLFALIVGQRRG
jgi:hypothetical protein